MLTNPADPLQQKEIDLSVEAVDMAGKEHKQDVVRPVGLPGFETLVTSLIPMTVPGEAAIWPNPLLGCEPFHLPFDNEEIHL